MAGSVRLRMPELVSACIDLSVVASAAIRKLVATGGATLTVDKSGGKEFDPQTVADLTSQHIIVDSLRAHWPDLQIIGEEGVLEPDTTLVHHPNFGLLESFLAAPRRAGWESAWDGDLNAKNVTVFVDPLDGTREFTEGIHSAVTVLIGIAYNGQPVAGVIQQPWYSTDAQRCVWGCMGIGVHMQTHTDSKVPSVWTECAAPKVDPGRNIVGTSRSHGRAEIDLAVKNSVPTDVIRSGGAGNKVLQLLDGVIDCYLYPVPGTKRWDTCAGEALLRASGGTLTDREGKAYSYVYDEAAVFNTGGVIAVRSEEALPHYVAACTRPEAAL
eukprot:m.104072 g.104072  ORF g.104072 m.104072 type:complete len:327 (+) comp12600_c0_seq2:180-1160(+)